MYISIFSDEIKMDLKEGISHFKEWGLEYIDLRGRVKDSALERLSEEELRDVRDMIDQADLKVGCLESSIGKVHLPQDKEIINDQDEKMNTIIKAADILDCRLVRCFYFWQPGKEELEKKGRLNRDHEDLGKVLELTYPLVEKARKEGLEIAFENCGVSLKEVHLILEELGKNNCGLAWDPHNGWENELESTSLEELINKQIKIAKVIHMKAYKALPEIGLLLPWVKVFKRLYDLGFVGPVSVETHVPALAKQKWGVLETNRRLVKVAQNLLSKVKKN